MNLSCALLLFTFAISGQSRVLWQQSVAGRLRAIEATPDRVFVAGSTDGRFMVAAYDARRGVRLWEDLPEGNGLNDEALVIAKGDDRVFSAGYKGLSIEEQSSTFLVRAYEESGLFLWESESSTGRFILANSIAASREHVFVGGVSENEQNRFDFVLRAYDAETGELRWEKTLGGAPVGIRSRKSPPPTSPLPLCVAGEAIIEGGSWGNSGRGDLVARAYEAGTGRLLWQAERQPSVDGSRTIQLLSQGSRVVALGLGFKSGQPRVLLLTMMQANNGRVLWEQSFEREDSWVSPSLLAAGSDGVFITSAVCSYSSSFLSCATIILAHAAATGDLMWQREVGGETGWAWVSGMSAAGGQLLMVGGEFTPQGTQHSYVRSHDPRTGQLRWEDLSAPRIAPSMVAVRAGLAFVGGFVDYLQVLRAYRTAPSQTAAIH